MNYRYKSYVSFKIYSDDITKAVNILRDSAISIYEMKVEGNNFILGKINWYDLKEFKGIIDKTPATVEFISKKGYIYTIFNYKQRLGLIFGAFLAFIMVFMLSNSILSIKIFGNESLSDNEVTDVLNYYGISIGNFIPALDLRECENQIITAFDKFSWIGIRSNGPRIEVQVSEINEKPETVPINSPCNIVSTKDAQVISIENVYRGMLIPMLNDGVKKGEVLISGTVNGKLEHDYLVHSMGDIIGRYEENISFFQPLTDQKQIYEKTKITKSIYILGMKIPLSIFPKTELEYEFDEDVNLVKLMGLTFPIGTVTKEINPYYYSQVEFSTEQAKSILEEKLQIYETNFYENTDIKIVNREVAFIENADEVILNVRYTLEGNIGEKQRIFAKVQ